MEKLNKPLMELLDLYFEKFSFKNDRKIEKIQFHFENKIEYSLDMKKEEKVRITSTIVTEDKSIEIELVTVGIFKLAEGLDNETETYIANKNTVAVIMPYIRSQIMLMTSQPGMTPIQLPLFNVDDLVENAMNKK